MTKIKDEKIKKKKEKEIARKGKKGTKNETRAYYKIKIANHSWNAFE